MKRIIYVCLSVIYIGISLSNANANVQKQGLIYPIEHSTIKSISLERIIDAEALEPKGLFSKLFTAAVGKAESKIKKPMDMRLDTQGTLYILDSGLGSLLAQGDKRSKLVGKRPDSKYVFPSLSGIDNFFDNRLLFTDSELNKLYLFDISSEKIVVLNDSLKMNRPVGVCYSEKNKRIYMAETGNHRILILNEQGHILKIVGKRGTGSGEFNFPTFIHSDHLGIIYVVDSMNHRIQIFDSDGNFIAEFGKQGDASGYFANPKGIATDTFGNIYIADGLFHNVQIFDRQGNFLYSFGERGTKPGCFILPTGIYIDKENRIYVADSYNSRIQVFKINTFDEN